MVCWQAQQCRPSEEEPIAAVVVSAPSRRIFFPSLSRYFSSPPYPLSLLSSDWLLERGLWFSRCSHRAGCFLPFVIPFRLRFATFNSFVFLRFCLFLNRVHRHNCSAWKCRCFRSYGVQSSCREGRAVLRMVLRIYVVKSPAGWIPAK
jgi:hypothetical protein